VPGIVADLCNKAGIPHHEQLGVSGIGGSRVIQHWDIAPDKNKAKEALESGKVDVMNRRSPIGLPVPEILKRANLGDQEEKLNRLLQELAWDAVLRHPLSGVQLAP
jgi:hypothetical protein